MSAFINTLISLIALGGLAPLASALSIPPHHVVPRQEEQKFDCLYEPGWEMCNEEGNRGCWVRSPDGVEYNIETDYEDFVPAGRERIVDLSLSQMNINADGEDKPEAKVFNKQFPGPLIEACKSSYCRVSVLLY
jgi:hypothetical protein